MPQRQQRSWPLSKQTGLPSSSFSSVVVLSCQKSFFFFSLTHTFVTAVFIHKWQVAVSDKVPIFPYERVLCWGRRRRRSSSSFPRGISWSIERVQLEDDFLKKGKEGEREKKKKLTQWRNDTFFQQENSWRLLLLCFPLWPGYIAFFSWQEKNLILSLWYKAQFEKVQTRRR